eukprot:Rmarinus@m.11824
MEQLAELDALYGNKKGNPKNISADENPLLQTLPESLSSVLDPAARETAERRGEMVEKYVKNLVRASMDERNAIASFASKLQSKGTVFLDAIPPVQDSNPPPQNLPLPGRVSRRVRGKMCSFRNQSPVTFERARRLYDIWRTYVGRVETNCKGQSFVQKLLSIDLHGAMLKVDDSPCRTFVGVSGIVLQETRRTFVIVTPEDAIKRVPKKSSVFIFYTDKVSFKIDGEAIVGVAHERTQTPALRNVTRR